VYRVGYLGAGSPPNNAVPGPVQDELRKLGYIEGRNVIIEWRWAEGHNERLPALAAELAALPVDVIMAATDPSIMAAEQAPRTIPVVFVACGDPVRQQFVSSLAHPGGNLTGVSASCVGGQLHAKQMDLLKELVPVAARAAVLWHATTSERDIELAEVARAA